MGQGPNALAYDGRNGFVYVAGTNVSVINGTKVTKTIGVGGGPEGVGYNSANGYVYVTNTNNNNVSIINGTKVVANVGVGSFPVGVVYSAADKLVFVANDLSKNVTLINGTTAVGKDTAGSSPWDETYDSLNKLVYVANSAGSNVTLVNKTRTVAWVAVGSSPTGLAYDSLNGYVYVANQANNNVSVINGTKVVATIPVGSIPWGVACDNSTGLVFVTNWGSGNVTVINGTSVVGSIGVGSKPVEAAYDYGNGYIYVANSNSNNISVISAKPPGEYAVTFTESGLPAATSWSATLNGATNTSTTTSLTFSEANGSYAFTVSGVPGYTPSPGSGTITVNGGPQTLSISFAKTKYLVRFSESGLSPGTSWSVTLGGSTQSSVNANIAFSEPNGTYNFSVTRIPGYNVYPSSGTVVVTGSAADVSVTFALSGYATTFTETGLPSGSSWSVTLNGSTLSSLTSAITFRLQNGTYAFMIASIPGYTAAPRNGSVMISGTSVAVAIVFATVNYLVKFSETGLGSGTSWTVSLNGISNSSTGTNISFLKPNGTYAYFVGSVPGYNPVPPSGLVTVAGAERIVSIEFVQPSYSISFVESRLPAGTLWSITLGSSANSSNTSTIGFSVPNGSYSYTVGSVRGFTSSPSSGTVMVSGAPRTLHLVFTLVNYRVTFSETGLPNATVWNVTLAGITVNSTSEIVTFTKPDGNYSFTVGSVSGFTVQPVTGWVTVDASPVNESVTFTPLPTLPTAPGEPTLLGLPAEEGFLLLGGMFAAAAGVAGYGLLRARRNRRTHPPDSIPAEIVE